ncbi:imidazole glycerol phosphate synthase [Terribacillus saccharophilus]|uniref:Imidazole glycerol phosphate synthase subunit HisH n=1 Tax=Terribacillus saccharophilus TaxID=361277 RepID=A0A075LPY2_9BACI|nr:imidazole glycerol phosphate synthase subunit HisH [Terribacillus goriensis]AIF66538.1 imidazole glycerol phosphate synthase [Terribacillus goriensis]
MIAIVDYGVGNVASVANACKQLGYETILTDKKEEFEQATHIILPGVGSFRAAMEEINKRDLRELLLDLAARKPFIGICVGMQLLFEKGFEHGETEGLGLIPGTVDKIETKHLLPHIGWNALEVSESFPTYTEQNGKHVYFVHSYQANTPEEYIVASTEYGTQIPAIVQNGNICGIQFHPEKSEKVGQLLLQSVFESSQKAYSKEESI